MIVRNLTTLMPLVVTELFRMRDRSPQVTFSPHVTQSKLSRRSEKSRVSVADLSSALTREYLVSLGYRKTLESFVKEDSVF